MSKEVKVFNAEEHLIDIDGYTSTSPKSRYLPVQWRKAWFRETFPNGKIKTEVVFQKEINGFLAEAKIYKDFAETEESFLANDFGFKPFNSDISAQEAVTQAIGRALGNAGFGTQFCSADEGSGSSIIADAGIPLPDNKEDEDIPCKETKPKTTTSSETPVTKVLEPDEDIVAPLATEAAAVKTENVIVEEQLPEKQPVLEEKSKDTLSVEDAKKMEISFGQYKGQTMGELFVVSPSLIRWYAEKYNGANKQIKEAAKTILSA